MSYRVTADFYDLEDGARYYRTGETFPRAGYAPTDARIAALVGSDNRLGHPVIEAVPDAVEDKPPRKRVKRNDA